MTATIEKVEHRMTTAPPPMIEREIIEARKAQVGRYGTMDQNTRYSDSIAFARAVIAARDAQWQAYASQARADLEAENKLLRWVLKDIADDYADRFDLESPSANPHIKYVIEAVRAALKEQP